MPCELGKNQIVLQGESNLYYVAAGYTVVNNESKKLNAVFSYSRFIMVITIVMTNFFTCDLYA